MHEQQVTVDQTMQAQTEKQEKIRQLIQRLEEIHGETTTGGVFVYSNDREIFLHIQKIQEFVQKAEAPIKVAVVVSHGGLWSLPKELEVDVVLRININADQLLLDKQRREEILKATKPEELLPQPNPDIDPQDFLAKKKELDRMEEPPIESKSYGSIHYHSSEAQLTRAKAFLKKNNIAFVGGSLTDGEFMKKIGDVLREFGAEVVFADVTNVMGWIGGHHEPAKRQNFLASLNQLPLAEDLPFLHSEHSGMAGRSPLYTKLSFGIQRYDEDSRDRRFRSQK